MLPTRMGHGLMDMSNDKTTKPKHLSVEDLKANEESNGICMTPDPNSSNGLETTKKRNASTKNLFVNEARRFSTKASHLIVQVPALQLRRIAQTSGIHSIRHETQHFVGIATLHGPLRIYRSRGSYRLFWILAMSFCFIMMSYQTWTLIKLYIEKPIVSQVSFLQPEEGMMMPLVTVCSFNFVNKHNLIDFQKRENVSQNLINFILQSTVDLGVLSTFIDETNLLAGQKEYEEFVQRKKDWNINEFFRSSSLICNETLRICNIGAEEFDCCQYASVIMTDMGNCYQLNLKGHPLYQTKQIGVNNGLQIYANFHSDEQENLSIPAFLNSNEMGFRYFVHAPEDYPFITSEGIGVLLGHRTFSAISPNRFVLMSQEEGGKCIDEWPEQVTSQNLSLLTDGLGPYSSTKCMAVCLATFFNEKCGCTPLVYNYNGTFPTCTVYQNYYDCLTLSLNVSVDSSADEIMRKVDPPCLQSCKMECQRWDYQIFNSYSQPFSRSATAYLQKHEKLRRSKLDKDFVGIDIYFRDIAYTEYKQVHKTTMNEVWSSLGGNMGLFLGMSLLSVIEVIIYLCKISWLFVSRKRRQHMIAKQQKEVRRKTLEAAFQQMASTGSAMAGRNRNSSVFGHGQNLQMNLDNGVETVGSRFRKIAGSLKRKSASLWPPRNSTGVANELNETEEDPDYESQKSPAVKSLDEKFSNFYLNNLVSERTHGMGKAANRDDVIDDDADTTTSSFGGTKTAKISRSRTLSISEQYQRYPPEISNSIIEQRRPTHVSLVVAAGKEPLKGSALRRGILRRSLLTRMTGKRRKINRGHTITPESTGQSFESTVSKQNQKRRLGVSTMTGDVIPDDLR
ncbi:hypothetical protein M3Y95_01056200 [Aphelenchoides besseyi]|nr:hypothetical protein M3Y95_01056200 [Aphelenchoides besseyi]